MTSIETLAPPSETPTNPPYLLDLNSDQLKAVTHGEGPATVIAGPGSGKTRVLACRSARLSTEETSDRLLLVTFTRKAAEEMRVRIGGLLRQDPSEIQGMMVSTFHSFCLAALRLHAQIIDYPNNFPIYGESSSRNLIRHILADFRENGGAEVRRLAEELNIHSSSEQDLIVNSLLGAAEVTPSNIASDISNFKMKGHSPQRAMSGRRKTNKKAGVVVYAEYEKRLRASNAMDYDDLVSNTVKVFHKDSSICVDYAAEYKYIMVDEYQDTNHSQLELIKLLARHNQNILVVGDPDQSIYKFRGADKRVWSDFASAFPLPPARYELNTNYRSTPAIVEASKKLIRNNRSHEYRQLRSAETETGCEVAIVWSSTNSKDVESEAAAAWITENLGDNPSAWGRCAVLYRANNWASYLADALSNVGVACEQRRAEDFWQRTEVRDILAWASSVLHSHDEVAIRRAITSPRRGVGDESQSRIALYASQKGCSFFDALSDEDLLSTLPSVAASGCRDFVEIMEGANDTLIASDGQAAPLLEYLYEATGYSKRLSRMLERDGQYAQTATRRQTGLARLHSMSEAESYTISELLEASETPILSGNNSEAVTLSTLHSAKGLEWENVLIVGMDQGMFPWSWAQYDDLEEERRLAYVGCTRAEKRLVFVVGNEPSPFVREAVPVPDSVRSESMKRVQARRAER